MKVAFAGTPAFAATALAAIVDAGHEVPLVLTQPDRQAGRGMKLQASAVKLLALSRGLPVVQPPTLRDEALPGAVLAVRADVLVVAAYGLLLPPRVLAWPRHGCVNIHASLLPRWRGAAPIQRALLAGDAMTGITLIQMDAGLDTGPVISRFELPIASEDTAGSLQQRLAEAGARSVIEMLAALEREGCLRSTPQPAEGVTHAPKIAAQESVIDWSRPAIEIDRQVRALAPSPGASSALRGEAIKVWRALPLGAPSPGAGVVEAAGAGGIDVGCGIGRLRIVELQRAGGKRLPAAAFLAGYRLRSGERFGAA